MAYIENRLVSDDLGTFTMMRIHGLTNWVDINPFQAPPECSITHRLHKGFSITFDSEKVRRNLQIGTVGETEIFIREIKKLLNSRWYWNQSTA